MSPGSGWGYGTGCLHNAEKVSGKAQEHEQNMLSWLNRQTREQDLIEAHQQDTSSYRIDQDKAYALWQEGKQLRCNDEVVARVRGMLVKEWQMDIEEWLQYTDFMYEQKLAELIEKVEAAGASAFMGPKWKEAKHRNELTWWHNLHQFVKFLFIQSRMRIVSLVATAALAAVSSSISTKLSSIEDSLLQAVTNQVSTDLPYILNLAAAELALTLTSNLVEYVSCAVSDYLVERTSVRMLRHIYMKVIHFDSEFFDRHGIDQFMSFYDDISESENSLHTALRAAIDLSTRLVMIYKRSPHLVVCVLGFSFFQRFVEKRLNAVRDCLTAAGSRRVDTSSNQAVGANLDLETVLGNVRTVRALSGYWNSNTIQKCVDDTFPMPASPMSLQQLVEFMYPAFSSWIIRAIKLCCQFSSTWLAKAGYVTPDTGSALHILIDQTLLELHCGQNSLSPKFIFRGVPKISILMGLLEFQPVIEIDQGIKPDTLKGAVEFCNVTFAYPMRRDAPVLKGVSFKVEAGSCVGLVGPCGCGKSTIFNLLMRFYDPQEGVILLDGIDLREYNVSWLREHMGEVAQQPCLFELSVEDNIRLGKRGATRSDVVEAARLANAFDFILKLPEGFNTKLGDCERTQLSGGQMQRIAIARAFVAQPRILLLDEYSSALDAGAEKDVQSSLDQLRKAGCTSLVIAHRLTTVQSADLIIVMVEGECVERGTHAQLMAKNNIYASLVCQIDLSDGRESDDSAQLDQSMGRDSEGSGRATVTRAKGKSLKLVDVTPRLHRPRCGSRGGGTVGRCNTPSMTSHGTFPRSDSTSCPLHMPLLGHEVVQHSWECVQQYGEDKWLHEMRDNFADQGGSCTEDQCHALRDMVLRMLREGVETDRRVHHEALHFVETDFGRLLTAWLYMVRKVMGGKYNIREVLAWSSVLECIRMLIVASGPRSADDSSEQLELSQSFSEANIRNLSMCSLPSEHIPSLPSPDHSL
eukprot:CAMPEP_0174306188 /NCGR_PEP_ID=MMETSP0810-20121108/285_1 /TAXON_ID=73025 ORGANISM="Eutreptiella gymnastica-like, Strain CCMP1594" /NCGR_SAMPLE_ID=MMETSP0810 /ASSEMBLY_ACC=CAM_ASM_000659 /LENGTH=975 /DNA_ID=CAMNT_0015412821 /DNA_START=86 /DNA_END=3015 /DNA_ORIENTATION=-